MVRKFTLNRPPKAVWKPSMYKHESLWVKFWHILCTCRCLSKEVGTQYFCVTDNWNCQTWHWWRVVCDLTSHNNTSQKNWHWCRVVCDLTSHNNTSQKNWPWWRVVCVLTSHNNTSQKNWHCWRALSDLTSNNNTSQKSWHWWRVVCDLASHNNHHKRIDIVEGRCETWHT